EPLGAREEAPRRHADVLQHELGGDRGAQRELPLDVVRREAGRAPLDQEAADRVAVLRPDDGQVGDRAVRDPSLRTGQDPGAAVALKVRSEHAERGQAQDEVPWELLARMAALDDRQRLPLDEAPDARLRDALLLGEELVDAVVVDLAWCHATLPRLAHMQGPSRHYWLATGRGRPYESI